MIYRYVTLFFLAGFFLCASTALAYNQLPEVLYGQTEVNSGGNTYYSTLGNEAVLNYDVNTLDGDKLLGFDKTILESCYPNLPLLPLTPCYQLDPSGTVMGLMNSRTEINGSDVYELATLLWPSNTIVGDIYGSIYNDFAFWGRNLNKSGGSVTGQGATWEVGSYDFNPQAQASYADSQKEYYQKRIALLSGEGQEILGSSIGFSPWRLQGKSNLTDINMDDNMPEGKIWVYDNDLVIGSPSLKAYFNLGTIVVNGDLTINSSIRRIAMLSSNSIGFIVDGDVAISNGVSIDAAIFATGTITVGDNVTMVGSFVAHEFKTRSNDPTGIRVYYDYRLDKNWPPGFRYFNMPTPSNVAP